MGPRNRICSAFDSAAFEFACDFLKRLFRIIAKLNDKPTDFEFGFVRHESAVFFGKAVWRVSETIVFRIGESAFVSAESNAFTLQLIEYCLLWQTEFFADLGGGKALFKVKIAVIGGVFPVALLEKLYRIQVRRSG